MVTFSVCLQAEANGGKGGCKIKGKKHPFLEQWSLPRLLPVSEAREGQRAQELYEKESVSSLSKKVPRGA